MERLTEVENGTAMIKGCGSNCKYGFEYCRKEDWENCKTIDDVINKLAEFEDFEEIFREKMTDVVCDILGDKEEFGKWLERKQWIAKKCDEYARAEEQGLLIKLPCKVGDTVYAFYYGKNHFSECQIKEIKIKHTHYGNVIYLIEPIGRRGNLYRYYEDDFGKTLFFTRAEAEQRLKEVEG